jgi:stage III sporulation protein AH
VKEEYFMTMNKQTMWLVTMLTLMVVLSAYYIVTGPVEPAHQAVQKKKGLSQANVSVKTTKSSSAAGRMLAEENASDYFVGYQLQRSTLRSQMTEEYMKILTDPESTKQQLKDAEAKINQLMKVDKNESVLEDLIRNEGYQDAVVITNDHHVDVIVQADKLANQQVVKLISLVKERLNIPASEVSVSYRP